MALHTDILDKYAALSKTNLPAKLRDDPLVTKNASPALEAIAKHLNAHIKMGASKAGIAEAAGMDAKTVARIAEKKNEPSTDKISGLAKAMACEPWQLLHPDGAAAAPSLESAVSQIARALNALDGPARTTAETRLRTVIEAPDSASAIQKAAAALAQDVDSGGGQLSESTFARRAMAGR